MSKKKKLYDFIVQIPGQPINFGVKATSAYQAYDIIMTALLRDGRATHRIKYENCKVSTKVEKTVFAKYGQSMTINNSKMGSL